MDKYQNDPSVTHCKFLIAIYALQWQIWGGGGARDDSRGSKFLYFHAVVGRNWSNNKSWFPS